MQFSKTVGSEDPRAVQARRRVGALCAATALGAIAFIGCASSSAKGVSAKSMTRTSIGVSHAQHIVASYSGTVSTYDTPKTLVGSTIVKGKTIMYIPLIQQIPAFQITASAMKAALGKLGAHLEICNGEATPTGVGTCINQGVSQHVAAIVTDSIPYVMAETAFKAATSAKVPVLITDQIVTPGTAKRDLLDYLPGNTNQPQLIADWIIENSNGKANAIVGEENEGPSQISYINNGLVPEFKRYCPGCTYKIVDISLDPTQAASTVSAALSANPNAQYYYGEFEDQMQGALQGVQQAGKASSLKVEFATATIAGLTKIKQQQTVYAEVGDDVNYQGWADTDDVLRMLAKKAVATETVPERIFTRQNIGSITLTNAAQASGVWYGNPAKFQAAFLKLWGAGH